MAYLKEFSGRIIYKIENNYIKEFSGMIKYKINGNKLTDFSGRILYVLEKSVNLFPLILYLIIPENSLI